MSDFIDFFFFIFVAAEVPSFEKKHGLWPCKVAPTKIIAGLGLSLDIDILEAPGATGDYRTLLTSKASAIAKALSAPLQSCPNVFVPGEDELKPGREDGYDFGFLHIKVLTSEYCYISFQYFQNLMCYFNRFSIVIMLHKKYIQAGIIFLYFLYSFY